MDRKTRRKKSIDLVPEKLTSDHDTLLYEDNAKTVPEDPFSILRGEILGKLTELQDLDISDIKSIALTLDSLAKLSNAQAKLSTSLDKDDTPKFTEIFLDKWKNDR